MLVFLLGIGKTFYSKFQTKVNIFTHVKENTNAKYFS